jgi:L-ascorbate metabolism protein UlaG (beta-lactamase superfamily)
MSVHIPVRNRDSPAAGEDNWVKVIRYTHSCVRLERDGRALVIDPGIWSETAALRGADAVLVTHDHADHVDELRLAGLNVPVYAAAGADLPGLSPTLLTAGETLDVAGFAVTAVGAAHAIIYNGRPDCAHLGYLVEDLYHPGDSVHAPGVPVTTLLVPLQGSWLKTHEAIDFVRSVNPTVAIGIHDAQLNDRGLSSTNAWLAETNPQYRYLAPGTEL